jgi:hypothetical protein
MWVDVIEEKTIYRTCPLELALAQLAQLPYL